MFGKWLDFGRFWPKKWDKVGIVTRLRIFSGARDIFVIFFRFLRGGYLEEEGESGKSKSNYPNGSQDVIDWCSGRCVGWSGC